MGNEGVLKQQFCKIFLWLNPRFEPASLRTTETESDWAQNKLKWFPVAVLEQNERKKRGQQCRSRWGEVEVGWETILLTLTELGRLVSNLQDSERSIRHNLTFRLFMLLFMFILSMRVSVCVNNSVEIQLSSLRNSVIRLSYGIDLVIYK